MTTRWKLTIEYDGTDFHGWQKQKNTPVTVQQIIEDAIFAFSGERVDMQVAGRTDAGVHALAQIAHFDLKKEFTAYSVKSAINYHSGEHKVAILDATEVDPEWHARFDATARSYCYHICNRKAPLTLTYGKAWHFKQELELEPMQEAAQLLIGHHDFSTFRATGCQGNSPMRTLDILDVSQEGDMFFFDVKAPSFLYNQVRNMVGGLSAVGTGHWSIEEFHKRFKACDRTQGWMAAPPSGLYFIGVDY